MSHPTVFELDVFIKRGATSAQFERHVSACASCSARLSRLALRASPARERVAPEARRFQAAAVALAACLAVLLVRTVSVLPLPSEPRAPEGVHGVAAPQGVMVNADAGPTDSGVR